MTDPSTELAGWRAHVGVDDLHHRFQELAFDASGWEPIAVPGHWRAQPAFAGSDGPVLYRTEFGAPAPPRDTRAFLVLDGVFYFADTWLDASYLGATDGYFTPHVFEVTELLRARAEHTAAIEVTCPRATDRRRKRTVTGVFSHWDNLDPEWNPGGLWRPVRLVTTGPVRVARASVVCTEAGEARGRLRVDATLDMGTEPPAEPVELVTELDGPDGQRLAEDRREVAPARGGHHIRFDLLVDDPPRWWPWRWGGQPRCTLVLRVEVGGASSDERRLVTAFREVRVRDFTFTINGERLYLTGSNQGPTRMALAEASADELARDVDLAVDANLDLLRLHAHVSRAELYDAADARGLLLWQDFPLQWGYARTVRRAAVRQARELVDLLGHHPSVVLWCAHNEPLAIDIQPGEPIPPRKLARVGASMFLPSWNKDVLDRSVARALHRADPSRPVDRYSGVLPGIGTLGTDSHFYFGWYHGKMGGLPDALRALPRLARFVSEFGAQAVPESAAFMEPDSWPDLDWERLFHRHACQRMYFDRFAPPGAFATFDAWRKATQEYQAALVQLQVEDLRRLTHRPGGGFCHFCFADGHPAVTWSVLDHERRPKLAYDALRSACRTVLPMLDPRTGQLHVASAARERYDDAELRVTIGRAERRFVGAIPPDRVTYVATVAVTRTESARVALVHPSLGTVENVYRPLLWRAVRGELGARLFEGSDPDPRCR